MYIYLCMYMYTPQKASRGVVARDTQMTRHGVGAPAEVQVAGKVEGLVPELLGDVHSEHVVAALRVAVALLLRKPNTKMV